MPDILRRHKYALNRILIPAARILSPEFNAAYIFLTGSHVELLRNLLDYANRETTFVDEYHDEYYTSPDSADWQLLQLIVAELELMLMGTVLGYYDAYVCARDKKTQGTQGGTFTSGAWRTRDINEEQSDVKGICSVGSNQITLDAGTYRALIRCPAFDVDRNQARLYDNTGTAVLLLGSSQYYDKDNQGYGCSLIIGRFTLSETSVLEVQHRCDTTRADLGFGVYANYTDEIYTIAEFWREV